MRRSAVLALVSSVGLGGLALLATPASAQEPRGSFEASCRNIDVENGMLTAECRDMRGDWVASTIPYRQCRGDIGNNDGILNCNGAAGQPVGGGPGYQGPGYQGPGPGYGEGAAPIYPEFGRLEDMIRDHIRQGVQDGSISEDQAHELFGQLHQIRDREQRIYDRHGANLPDDDRMRIRGQLRDLDHRVDDLTGRR